MAGCHTGRHVRSGTSSGKGGEAMKRSPMPRPDPEKTRDWRRRSAGMKRRSVRQRNPDRRAAAYARNFGDRAGAVRAMPCLCDRPRVRLADQQCGGDITASHARARGMGGCKGDRRQLVPLCYRHSVEAGEHGTSQRLAFESRYCVSLDEVADTIALDLDAQGYP